MVSRPSVTLSRLLAAGAIALAFTQPLAAQNPPQVIFRGDGNVHVVSNMITLTLSDAAIRSMIETNLPEALLGDSAHHVVLVVDANDNYVTGRVTNATVVSANGDAAGVHLDSWSVTRWFAGAAAQRRRAAPRWLRARHREWCAGRVPR